MPCQIALTCMGRVAPWPLQSRRGSPMYSCGTSSAANFQTTNCLLCCVLVLCGDLAVDLRIRRILDVDRQFDGRDAVENPQELLGLGGDILLRGFAQMPMPRRNLNLHRLRPHELFDRLLAGGLGENVSAVRGQAGHFSLNRPLVQTGVSRSKIRVVPVRSRHP